LQPRFSGCHPNVTVTAAKLASVVVAIALFIAAMATSRIQDWQMVATALLVPLALIWFAEYIDEPVRPRGSPWRRTLWGRHIMSPCRPSPSWLVAAFGWLFLAGVALPIWFD